MPPTTAKNSRDSSTETKIKEAARTVFHKKGFAATRTRDIAQEANINLALLNYYFRSKERLFELIMLETLTSFFKTMETVFNDETTSLEQKIVLVAEKYIDLITADPNIPLFIISEVNSHGADILEKLPGANMILTSVFIKQFKETAEGGDIIAQNPLHFLMNLMGLVIFPFLNNPLIKKVGNITDKQFDKLMQERKALIPVWIKAMLKPQ